MTSVFDVKKATDAFTIEEVMAIDANRAELRRGVYLAAASQTTLPANDAYTGAGRPLRWWAGLCAPVRVCEGFPLPAGTVMSPLLIDFCLAELIQQRSVRLWRCVHAWLILSQMGDAFPHWSVALAPYASVDHTSDLWIVRRMLDDVVWTQEWSPTLPVGEDARHGMPGGSAASGPPSASSAYVGDILRSTQHLLEMEIDSLERPDLPGNGQRLETSVWPHLRGLLGASARERLLVAWERVVTGVPPQSPGV
jgi:hypothetical protein